MALHSSITLTSLILSDSAASILASPPPTPASAAACSLSQGACSAETGRLTAASTTRLWTRSLASLLLAALLVHVHVSGELSPRMYLGAYGGLVYAALVECCMRAGNRPVDLAVLMRQVGRASGRLAAVVVVVLGGGGSSAALAMAALVHLVRVCSVVAGPGRAASFLNPLLGSDAYRQVLLPSNPSLPLCLGPFLLAFLLTLARGRRPRRQSVSMCCRRWCSACWPPAPRLSRASSWPCKSLPVHDGVWRLVPVLSRHCDMTRMHACARSKE